MLHILIIDDHPGDVMLVREGIRRSCVDADVYIAEDGEQALSFLSDHRPDLVILDLNLPKVNGFEVLQSYRRPDAAPVIVLSGSLNPIDRKRALELGAGMFVAKSPGFNNFVDGVRRAIEDWMSSMGTGIAH